MPLNSTLSIPDAYSQAGLAKLTVPQLKALCKERKIPGYSKLGKQALVQKLVENGLCSGDASGSGAPFTPAVGTVPPDATAHIPAGVSTCGSTISAAAATTSTLSSRVAIPSSNNLQAEGVDGSRPQAVAPAKPKTQPRKLKKPQPSGPSTNLQIPVPVLTEAADSTRSSTSSLSSVTLTAPVVHDLGPVPSSIPESRVREESAAPSPFVSRPQSIVRDASSSRPQKTSKRARPSVETMPPPPAKKRVLSSSTSNIQRAAHATPRKYLVPVPTTSNIPTGPPPAVSVPSAIAKSPASVSAPAKRFKPLVVNKAKTTATLASTPTNASPATSASILAVTTEKPLSSLQEFEASVPALRPITFPPSLAQRKRVHRWAVILSGLSNKERAACALVSRAFRYAVYLSASCILTREYHGRRLQDDVLRKHSQAMTNMWPYLRVRQAEVAQRRQAYETSFIARFFRKCGLANPVSSQLWTSPDNSKQLHAALRFALTRAWFELSVRTSPGGVTDPNSWLHGTVVDTQEVVAGEIWLVSVDYAASRPREEFYVLEATCEVVGHPSPSRPESRDTLPSGGGLSSFPVRADWSAYIEQRRAASMGLMVPRPLLAHLKWAGMEDYWQGISKLWLTRMAGEGPVGDSKRMVAERYVLACVVGNGISGQWMTANEMAQEFAGLPERVAAPPGRHNLKSPALNLYLPEHHHVESVHFTSAGGKDLHIALAVVQTPHREYFILRDNGMQVGSEEEGVAAVWQEVLRCDAKGLPA